MSALAKFGLLALFLGLLAVIGWLLWRNMQLKKQLANASRFQDDPARSAGRQSLVSAQETARQNPPYTAAAPADGQRDGHADQHGYEQAQTAPPHIVGEDDWEPDWPTSHGAHGHTPTGGEPPEPKAEAPLPRLTPQIGTLAEAAPPPVAQTPSPAQPAPVASAPTLNLPMDQVQDLVRRAPEMAASEFRAAANALGQWFEVNVNGTGGTLHLGEEDGPPRPLIAILQQDNSAVILPSAQYARDFAFQHYKIRNSEPLRAFFDLEVSSRIELAYGAPCLVTVEGQDLRVVQRGVLSGFSD